MIYGTHGAIEPGKNIGTNSTEYLKFLAEEYQYQLNYVDLGTAQIHYCLYDNVGNKIKNGRDKYFTTKNAIQYFEKKYNLEPFDFWPIGRVEWNKRGNRINIIVKNEVVESAEEFSVNDEWLQERLNYYSEFQKDKYNLSKKK